jgi:glycosyltransferase involved in cell wall biosynthesis
MGASADPSAPPPPPLTVVVPVLNEERHLDACLTSVTEALRGMDAEVLVIDGGSTDGSSSVAEAWTQRDPRIRVLENPERLTASAFNIGIVEGRSARVAIVSAHSTVEAEFFRAALARLALGDADVVGGPVSTIPDRDGVWAWLLARVVSHRFGVGNSGFRVAAQARYVDAVPFAVFERRVFERVGLFDTTLGRNQDTDLFGRIAAAGLRVFMDPAVKSTYRARGTLRGLLRQGFGNAYWNVLVWKRRPAAFRLRHAVPGLFVASLLGLGLAAWAHPLMAGLLVAQLLLYLTAATIAALDIARRTRRVAPLVLPPVFLAYHVCYGLGSVAGLRWLVHKARGGS